MRKLIKCRYCDEREFLDILSRYGWCRHCIHDNIVTALALGCSKKSMEFPLRMLSNFPELPIIESKNLGESETDLKIDFGIIKQRIKNLTYPKDIKDIFNV